MELFLVIVFALACAAVIGYAYAYSRFHREREELDWYRATYLRRQGSVLGFGDYELCSFDGGLSWYAVTRMPDKRVVIRGKAEDVYPGLFERLHGMDALIAHVKANGPIGASGSISAEDLRTLERAGFRVG